MRGREHFEMGQETVRSGGVYYNLCIELTGHVVLVAVSICIAAYTSNTQDITPLALERLSNFFCVEKGYER